MTAARVVGVDGCKFGWVAVFDARDGLAYDLFATFGALVDAFTRAERICVDVPIGLPWRACARRPCDGAARRALGPRAATVFNPPCRAASRAGDVGTARQLNLAELGMSLSSQAYGICRKIVEVDLQLQADERARAQVEEVHPEICFWALAPQAALAGKKTRAGARERLARLAPRLPESATLLARVLTECPRNVVARDDVLDALVAYTVAAAPANQRRRLQGDPANDAVGLPMQMVYAV